MFTNIKENEGASSFDELFLFYADELLTNHWKPHPKNPVVSDVKSARPAGSLFFYNNKLYRPSQDCSFRYGYATVINEIIEMNPEAERISGYTREYAIGRTYQALFGTEDNKEQLQTISREIAHGKKLQSQEVTVRRADGSTVDLSVSRSMELDDEGNPVIIFIGQDMSKQKAAELALRRSEERFRHVVDSAPAAILYMDNATKVIEINPEVEIVSGYTRDEVIGKTFYELFSDKKIRPQHLAIFTSAMNISCRARASDSASMPVAASSRA